MKTPTKEQLIEKYNSLDNKGKKAFEELYGTELFKNNKIDSFEQACKICKKNPKDVLKGSQYLTKSEIAGRKLSIITQAFNDNQTPDQWQDWSEDNNQDKYIPWFYMNKVDFRLFVVAGSHVGSFCGAGARFYFKQREAAEYCAKQFIELYKDLNLERQ